MSTHRDRDTMDSSLSEASAEGSVPQASAAKLAAQTCARHRAAMDKLKANWGSLSWQKDWELIEENVAYSTALKKGKSKAKASSALGEVSSHYLPRVVRLINRESVHALRYGYAPIHAERGRHAEP